MPARHSAPSARHARFFRYPLAVAAATASAILLSACGSTPPPTPAPATQASDTPPAPARVEAAPAPRAVAPAPTLTIAPLTGNPAPDSYAFRDDAQQLALDLARTVELDAQWVWNAIAQARVKENAARLMMPAPAGTPKNWGVYRGRFIDAQRIRAGAQFWRTHEADLRRAEAQYGVPAAIIAGVIGVETIYGRNVGSFRVLDVLTTLTLDFPKGRSDRSPFFKAELGQFLKLCAEQQIAPESVLGSYAGAIGLPQFMPSSIRRFAVDFDADGRIELTRSAVDAIGSVARFLSIHGWQPNWPAYFEVTPPDQGDGLVKLLAPDILPSFSVGEMTAMGAVLPPQAQNHPGKLALVSLQNGNEAPTMIAGTQNFYALTRYNQSSYYALAVVQLGEAVAQEAARQNGQTP